MGIHPIRCLRISLFSRVVLIVIFTLLSECGNVRNTNVGISANIIRLSELAKL